MPSIVLCLCSLFLHCFFFVLSEVLNIGIKSCFDGVVFQDAVCEECFSIRLPCLHVYYFCYCFYEGFIPKIILVSGFLPFIFISYPIKVFRFDIGIFRHSCAVPLLKTLGRLPHSKAFFVPDFISYVCCLL